MSYSTPPQWTSTPTPPVSQANLQILSDDITYLKSSAVVQNGVSTDSPNGVTVNFHIGSPNVACTSVAVYRNGLRKKVTTDYTFTPGNNYVTFTVAPLTGDVISFDYIPA